MNQNNKQSGGNFVSVIAAIIIFVVMFAMCGDSGRSSNSGKKWSDLSEVEKANAKWAYEVQQGLKD